MKGAPVVKAKKGETDKKGVGASSSEDDSSEGDSEGSSDEE